MVIVIIGILAGIAIPAITGALRTAKETAIRTEIDVMAQALESYQLEHGDYPPDFFDWDAVERHFRSAFPNIDNNELRNSGSVHALRQCMNRTASSGTPGDPRTGSAFTHYPHAIDRAEALVFCLGGFSNDKKHPFTGQGGPLVKISSAPAAEPDGDWNDFTFFQYNSERETGFFDFDAPQLSVTLAGGATPFAYSDDERAAIGATSSNDLGFVFHADPFPTYRPAGSSLPLVYFAASSYQRAFGVLPTATTGAIAWNSTPTPNAKIHHFQAVYMPAAGALGESVNTGAARPYASNVVDTTPPSTLAGFPIPAASTVLQFAQDSKFQIISAGLDDNYGGTLARDGAMPSLAGVGPVARGIGVYPSGEIYNPLFAFTPAGAFATVSSIDKYQDDTAIGSYYLSPSNPSYTLYRRSHNWTTSRTSPPALWSPIFREIVSESDSRLPFHTGAIPCSTLPDIATLSPWLNCWL